MKKRFFALFLAVLLMMTWMLPVSADEGKIYIIDEMDVVTDYVTELNERASVLSDTYGINVMLLMTNTTNGADTPGYAEEAYKASFGDADGIMLIWNYEETEWYIYKQGKCEELFSEADDDELWQAFANNEYYDECVAAYLNKAEEMLEEKIGPALESESQEIMESFAVIENTVADNTVIPVQTEQKAEHQSIPEERLLPRLVDRVELLTDREESELLSKLDEISERQKMDVVVVTVDGLEGKTAMAYADDFYDYNGYGYGDSRDGILLLISMEERDWRISTCGYGITVFTDAGQEYISDKFLPYLSDGDYSEAFTKYADLCDAFITQAREDKPYDVGNLPKEKLSPLWIFVDLLIGLVIAVIIGFIKKGSLTSVKMQYAAQDYIVDNGIVLTHSSDRFVNTIVTTRKIEKDDDSDGGSSTHVSSSGTTHGGSGGKF